MLTASRVLPLRELKIVSDGGRLETDKMVKCGEAESWGKYNGDNQVRSKNKE
jgi:hypothetical protein